MTQFAWIALSAASLALVASCASNPYRYVPAENRATNTRENNEALYNLPQDNPSGSLRVQYLGMENSQVHMRIVASNSAATGDWELDSHDFFISFPNGTQVQPASANPSTLKVSPGNLLGMDLFFPLPQGLASADQIREFDLHWQVKAIGENYAKTTAFDRVRMPNRSYAYDPYGPYWDPYALSSSSVIVGMGGWWG